MNGTLTVTTTSLDPGVIYALYSAPISSGPFTQIANVSVDSLLKTIGDDNSFYQALIMDTQGSELLVLKGAGKSLSQFKFIQTEAADFESYAHCARAEELTSYLIQYGFKLIRSDTIAEIPKVEQYLSCYIENTERSLRRAEQLTLGARVRSLRAD